jgi:superfamily I DNA/RNA helicase
VLIIPSNFAEHPKASPGERDIFSRLKRVEKGKDWIVLHSLELLAHTKKSQSEADFVFLVPGKGVLVLEVKAAKTISHGVEGWKIGSKTEKRGPFVQAKDAMFSIMEYLEPLKVELGDVPFVYAVWFTHISRATIESSISWKDEQVLTSEDLKRDITEVISETIDRLVSDLKIYKPSVLAPAKKLNDISQMLLPRFTAHQSPNERQKDVTEFLNAALGEQLEMVKLVTNLRAVLLPGLAGTGKTHIALHAARLAQGREERVLLVCYNNMLAEYLRTQMQHYPLVKVTSLHALMLEIADVDVPLESGENWWRGELPDLAYQNLKSYAASNRFDTLIIDEAQDIGAPEYLLILDALLEGGFKKARILACGDFEHQGVYLPGEETLANYSQLIEGLQILDPLTTNCRNTKMLGDFIVELLELEPSYDGYRRKDQESDVTPKPVKAETEIPFAVGQLLEEALRKYTPDQVVLLSAQKQKLGVLVEKLKFKSTEIRLPKTNHVRWGSPQEFKGLEALAVILIEFDTPNTLLEETFYVGATRSIYDFAFVMSNDKIQQLAKG